MGQRRDRTESPGGAANGSQAVAPGATDPVAEEGSISDEEGRELLQSVVDFTETVVREVMTPRPDIVAVAVTASLPELR